MTSNVGECTNTTAGNTFDCLRSESLQSIINATNTAFLTIQEQAPWVPVIDGPGGLIPDLPSNLYAKGHFARLPFIAGSCLDEGKAAGGTIYHALTSSTGPIFIPPSVNSTEDLREWIRFNSTPSAVSFAKHKAVVNILLWLYPDIPSLGSPFNTGNNTFGLSSQYKRIGAAMGDLMFHSLRRVWTQLASQHEVKAFSYVFSDPQPDIPPNYGGEYPLQDSVTSMYSSQTFSSLTWKRYSLRVRRYDERPQRHRVEP